MKNLQTISNSKRQWRLKTIITTIFMVAVIFVGHAQVSTAIEKRKPVLIDFTGMRCTPCGDVSLWLDGFVANNPDVIILGTHGSGSFAVPASPFDIDMRCEDADALRQNIALTDDNMITEVVGFPTLVLDGKNTSTSNIPSDVTTIGNEDSFVNIDLQTTLDETTREIAITVEMYFTADAPSEAFLNVGILQDDLFGYQVSQPGSISGNFTFNHVLRDMITATFGNSIGTPTEGQTLSETFNYTIPEFIAFSSTTIGKDPELIIGDLSIYAYVAINEAVVVGGSNKTHHIIETGEYQHLESTVATFEIETNQSFKIWPNPTAKNNGINISSETTLHNARIVITDILGKELMVQAGINLLANTPLKINTSKVLNTGSYIILIESDGNKFFKKLIIK